MHYKIKSRTYKILFLALLFIAIPSTMVLAGKIKSMGLTKPTISNVSVNPIVTNNTKRIIVKYKLSKKAKVTLKVFKGKKFIKTQVNKALKNSGYSYSNITGIKNEGVYTVYIDAIDLAKHKASTKHINFTIDTTRPIAVKYGFDKESFNPSVEKSNFIYNANEEVSASLVISSNNKSIRSIKSTKYIKSGILNWDGKDEKGNIVPGGKYLYQLTIADKAGNKCTKSGEISVNSPPVISIQDVLTPFVVNGYNTKDISYSLSKSAVVRIKIYNNNTLVKDLYNGVGNLGSNVINWDGKDDNGNLLTPGKYTIKFNAQDDSGNSANEVISTIELTNAKVTAINPNGTNLNLSENILSGSAIRLNIEGDTFRAGISSNDLILNNAPSGLSISSVKFITDSSIDITLNYTGDIDTTINNFNITVKSSALRGSIAITSENIGITSVIETISAVKQDGSSLNLVENNLKGAVLRLSLDSDTYKSTIATTDFILNNAPSGLRISSVNKINNTAVDIILDFTGDFDTNISNFNITAKANILNSNNPLTTANYQITSVIESIAINGQNGNSLALSENTVSESVIRVNLTGDTFKSALVTGDFLLNNAPTGLNINTVTRVNDTTVDLKLTKFTGDFDSNINNFSVTAKASGLNNGNGITSNDIIISAIDELVASKSDGTGLSLTEDILTGSIIRLTLTGDTFSNSLSLSDIQLNNAPTGVNISSVNKVSNNIIDVILSFSGTDFDVNINNFNITAKASGLTSSKAQTTKNITITAIDELTASKTDGTGLSLTENNLNAAVIRLNLTGGDNFKSGIAPTDFILNNAPAGFVINSINRVSSTVVDLFLSYDGTDFDTNINNFNITAIANGLKNGNDQTTANITITAAIESIRGTKTDGTTLSLNEGNLNGAVIRLNLAGDTFKNGLAESDFMLNNAPTGTSIAAVNKVSSTVLDITLGFDGTDFDDNISNFSITAKSGALTNGNSLTTANYAITTIVESLIATKTDGTGLILAENTLTGAVIRLTLTGDSFKSLITPGDFQLNNAPIGTTIVGINRINSNCVDITLGFDNTDFDTVIPNFTVTATGSGVFKNPLTTNNIIINPIIESLVAMKTDGSPLSLIEDNLNGSKIRLALTGDTFKTGINITDFQLNNAPAGLTIASITRVSPTVVDLTLTFDGTDFDSDILDFNINTNVTATNSGLALATDNYSITAVLE